ncbi:unnamed protein product [Rotaria sp. Silwood2]|nr:unnamed protein product [Rotaria sp. Silwood2]
MELYTRMLTLTAQSTYYSILFLDSDENHKLSDDIDGLGFFKSINDLLNSLQKSKEVKSPVCICSSNNSNILDKLKNYSNVACVFICAEHHEKLNEQNRVRNNMKMKEENFSDELDLWQMHVHIEAFHANADDEQPNVAGDTTSIMQNLIQKSNHISHISEEEI